MRALTRQSRRNERNDGWAVCASEQTGSLCACTLTPLPTSQGPPAAPEPPADPTLSVESFLAALGYTTYLPALRHLAFPALRQCGARGLHDCTSYQLPWLAPPLPQNPSNKYRWAG